MKQVPDIFIDQQLQEQFDTDGFVKLKLLEEKDIAALLALYKNYFPNPSRDFFSSSYENDFKLKKEISDAIGDIMLPNLEKVFVDYTWFGSAFLSKGDGPRSEMPMHQDWTVVDEEKYIALNIWTPLQETTEENGTLEVLNGSHRWHETLRAPTLPFYFEGYQSRLKAHLLPVAVKPGEAIVLNQAVIHYSKANTTKEMRVALTTGIKTKEAPMIFHYWNKEKPGEIELFKQDDDFLNRFTDFHQAIFKRPVLGESMGTKPFQLVKPTQQDMDELLKDPHKVSLVPLVTDSKKTFGKKLMEWIRK